MSSTLGVRPWCAGPGGQTRASHTRDNGITSTADNNDRNQPGVKPLPPMPPLIPLNGRRKRQRRVSECSASENNNNNNNKLLRLSGGGDSDSGVSVHSVDHEDVIACDNSEGAPRCTVILDPIPAKVLDSLTLAGSVSAEVAVRTCQHATHEWEESPPMISDNEVQGLLNGLDDEDVGAGEGEGDGMACCQRQESLLQQQPAPKHEDEDDGDVEEEEEEEDEEEGDKIDDVAESRDEATVATSGRRKARRKGVRRRRERRSTSSAGEGREKHRKRSTSSSTTSSTCSATSHPHKHRHKHRHRHRTPEPPPPPPRPRVNPIFVWVKQEDTRIVEVLCEDYDKRNRIRLTKTPHGWRAIPRTERLASFPSSSAPSVPSIAASSADTLVDEPTAECSGSSTGSSGGAADVTSHLVTNNEEENDKQYPPQDVSLSQQTKVVEDEERPALCDDVVSTLDDTEQALPLDTTNCHKVTSHVLSDHVLSDREGSALCDEHPVDADHEEESVTTNNEQPIDDNFSEINNENVEHSETVELPRDVADCMDGAVKESVSTAESVAEQIEPTVEPEITLAVQKDDVVPDEQTTTTSTATTTSTTMLDTVANEMTQRDVVEKDELVPTDLTLPKSKDGPQQSPKVTPVRSMASILRTPKILTPTLLSALSRASPRPGISPALPEAALTSPGVQPAHQNKLNHKSVFLESLLSTPRKCHQVNSQHVVDDSSAMPLDLGKTSSRGTGSPTISCSAEEKKVCIKKDAEEQKLKSCKVENVTLKTLLNRRQEQLLKEERQDVSAMQRKVQDSRKTTTESTKDRKSRLLELLTSEPTRTPDLDPLTQLKKILSDPDMAIPDPLLVPRDRLHDLVSCPAKEIPRLLTLRPELRLPEALAYPSLLQDPNLLVVSISYLQSLLRSPDKPTKVDDRHSTLGAFLEWQRYQGMQQHEFLEAQLKHQAMQNESRELDAATAHALNQMMWVPYLSQLEASAKSCGNNQEFVNMLNAVFPAAATYPNAFPGSGYPQAMSPGFPIPSDYKSQMELQHTLAMWQEAMMQSAMTSPPPGNVKPVLDAHRHSPKKCVSTSARTSPIGSNFIPQSRGMGTHVPVNGGYPSHPHISQHPPRHRNQGNRQHQPQHQQHNPHHQHHHSLSGPTKLPKTETPSATLDPHMIKSDPAPTPRPTVTCKPLRNLLSSPRRDEVTVTKRPPSTSHSHLLAALGKPHRPVMDLSSMRPQHHLLDESPTAKLKVKQHLVDPALTPQLLKQEIKPEVALHGDDKVSATQLHPNLWHPLFGSQKSSYNSPWQWTTVTVNGE